MNEQTHKQTNITWKKNTVKPLNDNVLINSCLMGTIKWGLLKNNLEVHQSNGGPYKQVMVFK